MANFAYVHTLGGVVARKTAEPASPAALDPSDPSVAEEDHAFSDRWFFDSSFELKHGLIVREVAPDAFPQDAFERLFQR